jgi:hypothetical protein
MIFFNLKFFLSKNMRFTIFTLVLFFCFSFTNAQDSLHRPKLFINCASSWGCFEDYVRTELSFFDFVRDRFQADVQILIISQENGAGGANYTLNFIGQGKFKNEKDTLKFSVKQADSDDMIRKKLVSNLKIGLVPYIKSEDFLEQISIDLPKRKTQDALIKKDPWNFWVFTLGTWGNYSAESNSTSYYLSNYLNINRIKPESKVLISFNYDTNFSKFVFQDVDANGVVISETVKAKNENHNASFIYAKSLSEHWALGGYHENWSSVARNIRFGYTVAPALEYNIFPNSRNTQKQFRCILQTGLRGLELRMLNEREKTQETLPFYRFDANISIVQPWGNVSGRIGGHHFFTEKNLYRFNADVGVSWRVFEGFNLNLFVNSSYIKDQILFLPQDINRNNVLLGAGILPTNFRIYTSGGISYTFGSINNSVVNPRLNGIIF